jgi:hypothetical protein
MIDRDGEEREPRPGSPLEADLDPDGDPFRERMRQRLGLSKRQWEYLVAGAIAAPYPIGFGLYLLFDVSETTFLVVMSVYSLVAMYGSYKL